MCALVREISIARVQFWFAKMSSTTIRQQTVLSSATNNVHSAARSSRLEPASKSMIFCWISSRVLTNRMIFECLQSQGTNLKFMKFRVWSSFERVGKFCFLKNFQKLRNDSVWVAPYCSRWSRKLFGIISDPFRNRFEILKIEKVTA